MKRMIKINITKERERVKKNYFSKYINIIECIVWAQSYLLR